MINKLSVPSLTQANLCPDNPRHFISKPCKKCGGTRYYVCNRSCIECVKYRVTRKPYEYVPNEEDKVLALIMYFSGMSIQEIKNKLGCFAKHVRMYLDMPQYRTPARWNNHKRRYQG